MAKLPTAPRILKDGFYIEVCSFGSKNGIKISSINKVEMFKAKAQYDQTKYVIILGEHKNGKWLSEKILPEDSFAKPGKKK